MNLSIDELLDYTDEERAKWDTWFGSQGNDALKLEVPMEAHPNLGALILHCFWAEMFYARWMQGDVLTPERVKEMLDGFPTGEADKVFAFGRSCREELRKALGLFAEEDWSKPHSVNGPGFQIEGSARKLIGHILVHEIRHWAQVALTARQHGLAPPGEHDLLFSTSFGPLVTKS